MASGYAVPAEVTERVLSGIPLARLDSLVERAGARVARRAWTNNFQLTVEAMATEILLMGQAIDERERLIALSEADQLAA